jgi:hypothetical protein
LLILFMILHVPRYSRCLPSLRMDKPAARCQFQKWHDAQAEHVRGL